MNSAMSYEKSIFYQEGYAKGFKEGYWKAFEIFKDELVLAITSKPMQYVLTGKEAKELFKRKLEMAGGVNE